MRRTAAVTLFFLVAPVLCAPRAGAGELRYATVFSVKGPAEVRTGPRSPWKPLKKDASLPTGACVRTRAGGSVSVIFDSRLEGLAHLEENSALEVLKSPNQLQLDSGKLFLVLEDEKALPAGLADGDSAGTVLTVKTREVRAHVGNGGCSIESLPTGTQIKVYGGRVKVAPEGGRLGAVEEGFLFFTGRGNENRFERMRATDYADWQTWIRSWYEKKDDFEAQSHENDVKRRKASQKEET